MDAEKIITFVILFICTVPLIGIGIAQCKSKKPVAFWSGVKPPDIEQVTDVEAYNKKHGRMWILYGAGLLIFWYGGGLLAGDTGAIAGTLAECLGGIIVMIVLHNRWERRYVRKKKNM